MLIALNTMEITTNTAKLENGEWKYSESLSMRKMIWILLPVFIAIMLIPMAGKSLSEIKTQWNQDFWGNMTPLMILLSVAILFWNIRLNWSISNSEFSFTFFPFVLKRRTISMMDIEDIQVLKINSLKEFGGWGLRRGKLGKAYTTSGNYILHVKLKHGSPINVSVMRPEQAREFLQQLKGIK